jgi:threonine dehydrogenase-like Zn-dependent dehydrogenase
MDSSPQTGAGRPGERLGTALGLVQRYLRPLLDRIRAGEIDPSFVISHTLPLDEAPRGYDLFKNKQDECTKVVLKP